MFLRKPTRALVPLPVTMAGVRMGERALQIGIDDTALTGLLASKPGLSGHAVIAVADDDRAARAQRACADAGVLVDIHVGDLATLPLHDGDIDVAIVHISDSSIAEMDDQARDRLFRECYRVLRIGGRLVLVGSIPESGVGALFRRRPAARDVPSDLLLASLERAGFRSRLLAEREGYRFCEGLKG
jgi:SAM-dependent methyltransferase